jgi:hypothetical protein
MRKTFCVIIAAVMLISCIVMPSSAKKNGSVIGYSRETDINAYIDGHLIGTYNVNNRMAIVAEDLKGYGFSVEWQADGRTLEITRTVNDGKVKYPSTYPDAEKNIVKKKIGSRVHEILNSDIKTYVNGKEVEGFNINGKTMIYFKELKVFGSVTYNNVTRTTSFKTGDDKCIALYNARHPEETEETAPQETEEVAEIPWSASYTVYNTCGTLYYSNLAARIIHTGWTPQGGSAVFNISNDLPNGVTFTVTEKSVSVSLYPAYFANDEHFLKSAFYTAFAELLSFGLPDDAYTDDHTNTDRMRAGYTKLFECSVAGNAVSGDLWIGRGADHIDLNFDFTDGTEFHEGDVLSLKVGESRSDDYEYYSTILLAPKEGASEDDIKAFFESMDMTVVYASNPSGLYEMFVWRYLTKADVQLLLHSIDESGLFDVVNREYLSHLE